MLSRNIRPHKVPIEQLIGFSDTDKGLASVDVNPDVNFIVMEDGSLIGTRVRGNLVEHFSAAPGENMATVVVGTDAPEPCVVVEPELSDQELKIMSEEALLEASDTDPEQAVIDYLILYQRNDIESRIGGALSPEGWFKLREEQFNRSWSESGFMTPMRFVKTVAMDIERDGRNYSDFLYQLRNGDREFAEVQNWADFYGADGVMLYIDNIGVGGVNYLMKVESTTWGKSYRFGLVDPDSAVLRYSDVHEVGHGMGLAHHVGLQGGSGLYPHSSGGACPDRHECTIMTYESVGGRRRPWHSDGGVRLCSEGKPLSEAEYNAVLSHQKVAPYVTMTRLRKDENHGEPIPSPPPGTPPPPPPPPPEFGISSVAEQTFEERLDVLGIQCRVSFNWKDASGQKMTIRISDWGTAKKYKCRYIYGQGRVCEGRIATAEEKVVDNLLGSGRTAFDFMLYTTDQIEEPKWFTITATAVDGEVTHETTTLVNIVDPRWGGGPVPNQPPEIVPIPDVEILAGDTMELPITATDPDNDPITLTKASGPSWMTVVGTKIVLAPPANTLAQTLAASITATDSEGNKSGDAFSIVVKRPDPWVEVFPLKVEENTETGQIRLNGTNLYNPA